MFSRRALASTLIATTVATILAASSTTARADDTTTVAQGQQGAKPKKQKQQGDQSPAPSKASQKPKSQPKEEKVEAPPIRKVEEVTESGNDAISEAQEDIVGAKQHRSNEEKARDPKLRPKDDEGMKRTAEAVGNATTTAAEVIGSVVVDSTRVTDKPGDYKPFAIELNPLGLIVGGRFSVQAEWAPATHHVILVSPHFIRTSADVPTGANTQAEQTFTGFGGELGYRYYTGHRGMNGFFIGPSLLGGGYNAGLPGEDKVFSNFGIAADIGVQGVVANHLVLGGGLGLEYLWSSHDFGDLPLAQAAIASSGLKPRLLFSAGYAF